MLVVLQCRKLHLVTKAQFLRETLARHTVNSDTPPLAVGEHWRRTLHSINGGEWANHVLFVIETANPLLSVEIVAATSGALNPVSHFTSAILVGSIDTR